MKRVEHYRRCVGGLVWLLLALLTTRAVGKPGEIYMGKKEQTFPVLQTKTGAYTNVTVTKKTKEWIFIIHSAGVCNIKATDLPTDARVALGYEEPPKVTVDAKGNKVDANSSASSTTSDPPNTLPKINLAEVKQFAAEWRQNRKEKEAELKSFLMANAVSVTACLGILAVVHIIQSALFWMICRKTHSAPGPLVWVPILQLLPLLRAANMSPAWFFAFFLPGINIIAMIVFSIKIVKSRGKSPWVTFLLILPPTSGIAMLYLAFSSSAPVEMANNEVLSLETA